MRWLKFLERGALKFLSRNIRIMVAARKLQCRNIRIVVDLRILLFSNIRTVIAARKFSFERKQRYTNLLRSERKDLDNEY